MNFNSRLVTSYSGAQSLDFPQSFEQAERVYAQWRDKKGRRSSECKLAGNTTLELRGEDYAVRYHRTDVVTFRKSGSILLDSGGWQTVTTRDRMNRAGVRIGMSDGVPSVRIGSGSMPYVDGMLLLPAGGCIYPKGLVPCGTYEDIRSRRRRHLARFNRALATGLADSFPTPFYWETRQGGETIHDGTVPEVFAEDSGFGLAPARRRKSLAS